MRGGRTCPLGRGNRPQHHHFFTQGTHLGCKPGSSGRPGLTPGPCGDGKYRHHTGLWSSLATGLVRRLVVANPSSFAARSYRDDAVVLRTHKLGEADRIITLLTKHHGQVRAVAKGVRRTTSRFGARLEPFMVADLQLISGRTLDIVTQAVAKGAYGSSIAADYGRFTVAAAMTETAEKLTDADAESGTAQ